MKWDLRLPMVVAQKLVLGGLAKELLHLQCKSTSGGNLVEPAGHLEWIAKIHAAALLFD
jgi:hypothetical protein